MPLKRSTKEVLMGLGVLVSVLIWILAGIWLYMY